MFLQLRTHQYRNLSNGTVCLDAPQVFVVGPNGQGKSNLLDALYTLAYGASFRTRHDQEVATHGTTAFGLIGTIRDPADCERSVHVRWVEGVKQIELDESVIRDRRDLVSVVPTVIFRHDDMSFVSGGPALHRYFLDQTLSLDNPVYIDDLRRYRTIVRSRNEALRRGDGALTRAYSQQLAATGFAIQQRRQDAFTLFERVFGALFMRISGLPEPLVIRYQPSWRDCYSLEDALQQVIRREPQEQLLGSTTSGPHRDRIAFLYNESDWLSQASTGQLRLTALILRLAQAHFLIERHGSPQAGPVLLLDDVLLELDPEKRERFVLCLPPVRQRVFTFLPGEPYEGYRTPETLVYLVDDGRFILHTA